jgi:hypothetical protein
MKKTFYLCNPNENEGKRKSSLSVEKVLLVRFLA